MLKEYVFIDRLKLKSYAEQIGASMATEKRPQWKVALGLAGPSVEGQQTATARPANDHELIQSVTEHLERTGQLRTTRPTSSNDQDAGSATFILESMKARKVIFACEEGNSPRGLQEIVVWVSNPTERPSARSSEDESRYEATGMFVYLLEGYWNDGTVQRAYSMMTALTMLLGELSVAGAKKGTGITFDTSRQDFASPVDILVRNGGTKGEVRTVTALYRVRAVSENKIVNVGGVTLRCHDLFGYPIYIAAE